MAKILSFSGSNNSNSINKKLGSYANTLIRMHEVNEIKLENYDVPIFSIDLETNEGIPEKIKKLREIFLSCDGFMITCPEHNGSMPAFFKNIMDWISRSDDGSIFNDKPVLIMSTSPGGRGGMGNRENLVKIMPHWGAKSVFEFGLGKFNDNFDSETNQIKDEDSVYSLKTVIKSFEKSL